MKSRPTSPAQHIAQVGANPDGVVVVRIGDLCQDVSTANVSRKACTKAQHPTACACQLGVNLQVSVSSETAIRLKRLQESCWPPIAQGIALGIPVWQFS